LIRYREVDVEDWIETCPEVVTGSH
jgi:hypothetical protein